jgi:hypothetical protein
MTHRINPRATVAELEVWFRLWREAERAQGNDPDIIFELVDAAGPYSNTFKRIEAGLRRGGISFHQSDLMRAINNVVLRTAHEHEQESGIKKLQQATP